MVGPCRCCAFKEGGGEKNCTNSHFFVAVGAIFFHCPPYSKVARKIGALKRSSRQLTRQARRSFFLTVIQPDLEYSAVACIPNMPEFQKQRLLTLWRKAVRCVAGTERHAGVDPICIELSLRPLDHRWALNFAMLVRRCYMNQAPAPLYNYAGN